MDHHAAGDSLPPDLKIHIALRYPRLGVHADDMDATLRMVQQKLAQEAGCADATVQDDGRGGVLVLGHEHRLPAGTAVVLRDAAPAYSDWELLVTFSGRPQDAVPIALYPGLTWAEVRAAGGAAVVIVPLRWA